MSRNCNLELQLLPTSPSALSSSRSPPYPSPALFAQQHLGSNNANAAEEEEEQQQQQMTIFYNGKICVCDVTVIQARAIIWKAATREMEERRSSSTSHSGTIGATPSSDRPQCPTCLSPSPSALSMKRSLQHFLESRRHRIQAASPYHRPR